MWGKTYFYLIIDKPQIYIYTVKRQLSEVILSEMVRLIKNSNKIEIHDKIYEEK